MNIDDYTVVGVDVDVAVAAGTQKPMSCSRWP